MLQQAVLLHQKGQLSEAAALYCQILAREPGNADALHLLGVIEFQKGNPAEAIVLIDRAIAVNSTNGSFFNNRANALKNLGRFDEALGSYDRALAIIPGYADALYNRGVTLQELGRFDEAVDSYDRALAIQPAHFGASGNRGAALQALKRMDEALASFDRALAIKPDFAEALNNRGAALQALKRYPEAIASYDRALAIWPEFVQALIDRGAALQALMRFPEAVASYDRALAIKPDHAKALNSRGRALQALKRNAEALASFDRALAVKPDFAEALYNRGLLLQILRRLEEAIASYDRALAIDPDYPYLLGDRLYSRMLICDWPAIADDFDGIAQSIDASKKVAKPFGVAVTPLSAALQRKCSEIFAAEEFPENPVLPRFEAPYRHDRIRLGYFSADFYSHATAFLIAELLDRHDRSRFEVTGFSFGAMQKDAVTARLAKSFDRFVEVGAMTDKDIALLARRHEIDIAVDLKGFTADSRTGIFALRAAPVQVSYLGYPGTLGAPYIDYLIADRTLIPPDQQQYYAEKIAYLPDCYQPNDSRRAIPDMPVTRAACGLPEEGFVFCCFNNLYKILPEVFDVWMRLLEAVKGSVLWLLEENPVAARNLKAQAQARGIDPARLIFGKRIEPATHLARQRVGDLFLDTLPCNAHTTASDALWAGLPVLTCLGQAFPGRVAASLLRAAGLAELVTGSLVEYEALAKDLATDPERLRALKDRLAANRLTCPLYDAARYAGNIEAAYAAMWQRHQAGLAPEHIHVS